MTTPNILISGPLRAEVLPGGIGLRDVAVGQEVLLRGLQFVVRDRHWGTYGLTGTMVAAPGDDRTKLTYRGTIDGADGDLVWEASFRLERDRIVAICSAVSTHGFATNRTGLVVLHDLPACLGAAARVVHPDGGESAGAFPVLVAPRQPFLDIARLEHRTRAGHAVTFVFSGEVFETEDQRNWTDASFKTYSRPLWLGYPYRIAPGERVSQSVSVSILPAALDPPEPDLVARTRIAAVLPALVPATGAEPGPFADFNRAVPAPAGAVFGWSASPTVHAADDDTIGESVEPLPALVATAIAKAPGEALRVGPIRLETRFGGDPTSRDPRRGGVLEAAWVAGTIAGLLDPAVAALAFDVGDGAASHLLARLAQWQGAPAEAIEWPALRRMRGLALGGPNGRAMVVAHLRGRPGAVAPPPGAWYVAERLGAAGFSMEPLTDTIDFNGFGLVWLTGAT